MKKLRLLSILMILTMILGGCGSSGSSSSSSSSSSSYTDSAGSGASANSTYSVSKDDGIFTSSSYDTQMDGASFGGYDTEEYIEEEYIEEEYSDTTADYSESTEDYSDTSTTNSTNTSKLYESKLVYRCEMNIETLNYDESYSKLRSLIDKYECIIESETYIDNTQETYDWYYSGVYETGKRNYLTVRVPSAKFYDFVNENGGLGNVTEKQTSVDNITQKYYDTTAQVEGLEAQLERLQEMLDTAYDVDDMITINEQITEVEYMINYLKTEIRTMDMDTTYSYVTIELKEVVEYTQTDEPVKTNKFIDRLKNQLKDTWLNTLDSLEEILFSIIDSIPTLLILGVIFVIIRVVNKKKGSKKTLIDEALEVIKEAEEKENEEE